MRIVRVITGDCEVVNKMSVGRANNYPLKESRVGHNKDLKNTMS